MTAWQPNSWQRFPNPQAFEYPDKALRDTALETLAHQPPLVLPNEVLQLQRYLAEAAEGKRFILQAGDCAESFSDNNPSLITQKVALLIQLAMVLVDKLHLPVLLIGRMAGQFAKPRSANMETQHGLTLPSYRGDLINSLEFSEKARTPNPKRLLQGYAFAAQYLNFLRSLEHSGFTDIQNAGQWRSIHPADKTLNDHLDAILKHIGAVISTFDHQKAVFPLFTSHEAFHLDYEQALTRQIDGRWYNLSTHLPWIGMRTLGLENAHMEYARGIENPLGIKIGPELTASELQYMIRTLNPQQQLGKLCLIHRLGVDHIQKRLPELIKAAQQTEIPVLWMNDPMHGNTKTTASGGKIRVIEDMFTELSQAFLIHQQMGSHLAGIHLEVSEQNIHECTNTFNDQLSTNATARIDPRLNFDQALALLLKLR